MRWSLFQTPAPDWFWAGVLALLAVLVLFHIRSAVRIKRGNSEVEFAPRTSGRRFDAKSLNNFLIGLLLIAGSGLWLAAGIFHLALGDITKDEFTQKLLQSSIVWLPALLGGIAALCHGLVGRK